MFPDEVPKPPADYAFPSPPTEDTHLTAADSPIIYLNTHRRGANGPVTNTGLRPDEEGVNFGTLEAGNSEIGTFLNTHIGWAELLSILSCLQRRHPHILKGYYDGEPLPGADDENED